MANLGEDPELESKLFCEDCRRGVHGKVLSYDGPEIRRLLELKEYQLNGQCKHCGNQLPKAAGITLTYEAENPLLTEPVRRGPGRPRSVPVNG